MPLAIKITNVVHLARMLPVQLLSHRFSRSATSSIPHTSSNDLSHSMSFSNVMPTPDDASNLLLYNALSQISPLLLSGGLGLDMVLPDGLPDRRPGTSRARADAAAAVAELRCAADVPVVEDCNDDEDARTSGSKCSLSRSNSRKSGSPSSIFCS